MRKLPGIVLLLGLLLLGGLAWWMLHEGGASEDSQHTVLGARSADEGLTAASLPVVEGADTADLAVAPVAAPVAAAVAGPARAPESYRRALGALTGRVLNADQSPVPGMPVEIVGGRRSLVIRSQSAFLDPGGLDFNVVVGRAVTGADGRFTLAELQPRTIGVLLLDPAGPHALLWPLEITPVSGETRDLGDLVLPATATLRGRIVDERGAPLAGARVRATDFPYMKLAPPDLAHFREGSGIAAKEPGRDKQLVIVPPPSAGALVSRLPVPTTFSAADGAFELPGVPLGLVTLVVDEPQHLALMESGVDSRVPGAVRELGNVVLGDGVVVHGRVLDDDDKPVAGATVMLGNSMNMVPGAVLRGAITADADGAFTARGYRAGGLWGVARVDARHEWTLLTDLDPERAEIRLAAERTLTLAVVDSGGVPVAGARLFGRVVPDDEVPDLLMTPHELADVSVDEAGRYVVGTLEPEKWEIVVKAPGRPAARESIDLTKGDATETVTLGIGRTLAVRVVDPLGQPVEWADVEGLRRSRFEEPALATGRTDADGRAWLADLPAGELHVMACHPGWAVGQTQTEIPEPVPGQPVGVLPEVVVTLEAGGRILGTVLDHGRPPTQPLMVIMVNENAPGDELLPRLVLADLEGRFNFDRVAAGKTHLEVRDPQTLSPGLSLFESLADSPLAEDEVEVAAQGDTPAMLDIGAQYAGVETGTLGGTITVNGLPGDGWKVRTWGDSIRRSVAADTMGRFDLGRIEAGHVNLALSPPSAKLMEGFTDEREFELGVGEQKLVDLQLSTAAVGGHVISAVDGRPVVAARVQIMADGSDGWGRSGFTVTGEDGSFRLEPIAAGKYRARIRADGHANFTSDIFELKAMEDRANLNFRLTGGLRVSGHIVVDSPEQPNWMWIIATRGETRDTSGIEKEDKSFAFDGLSPGEWNFQLATDLDTEYESVNFTITTQADGITLVFKPKPPPEPEPAGEAKAQAEAGSSKDGDKR